jgi:hypothetical protein
MKDQRIDIVRGIGEALVVHSYPYSTLPRLECHVHPKFAIFEAGMKLNDLLRHEDGKSCEALKNVLERHPSLKKIQILYRVWMYTPNNASEDKTYVDPDLELVCCPPEVSSDDNSDGSEYGGQSRLAKSVAGRGTGYYLSPRTRSETAAEQAGKGGMKGTPEAPVRKRKVLSESFTHNQQLLSEMTLSRFDEQIGEAAWTSDRIRLWSSFPKKRRVVPSNLGPNSSLSFS